MLHEPLSKYVCHADKFSVASAKLNTQYIWFSESEMTTEMLCQPYLDVFNFRPPSHSLSLFYCHRCSTDDAGEDRVPPDCSLQDQQEGCRPLPEGCGEDGSTGQAAGSLRMRQMKRGWFEKGRVGGDSEEGKE